MYCPKCAVRLVEEANFCHNCGICLGEDGMEIIDSSLDGAAVGSDQTASNDNVRSTILPATRSSNGLSRSKADEPETELWEGRFSPKAMVGSYTSLILGTGVGLVCLVTAMLREIHLLWILLLFVLPALWILQLLRTAKRWLVAHYRLTDRRLFLETGLFNRHKDQLDLARVEDVRVRQNVLHRLLDVGSIEVLSSDRRLRRVIMEGMSGADELAEHIRSLARRRQVKPASMEGVKA